MRFFHWLGHVLIDIDCGVHTDHDSGRTTCKTCGREVSVLPKEWRR